jgi:hypothetical protein
MGTACPSWAISAPMASPDHAGGARGSAPASYRGRFPQHQEHRGTARSSETGRRLVATHRPSHRDPHHDRPALGATIPLFRGIAA